MKFGKHIIITEMSKHPTYESKYLTAQGTYKAVQDSHDNIGLKKTKKKKINFIITSSYSSMSILVKNIFSISTSMKNHDYWEQKSNQKEKKRKKGKYISGYKSPVSFCCCFLHLTVCQFLFSLVFVRAHHTLTLLSL